MLNKFSKIFISIFTCFIIFSCSTQKVSQNNFINDSVKIKSDHNQKADHFIVITDASRSMADSYKGQKKINISKQVLYRLNSTISELGLTCRIITIGQTQRPHASKTETIYGPKRYIYSEFDNAIDSIDWASGLSPLNEAIDKTYSDLSKINGNINLFIISDAEGIENNNNILYSVKKLKNTYKDRLSIYPILVGNDSSGEKLLKNIALTGESGFFEKAENICSGQSMADYSKKAFLESASISSSTDIPKTISPPAIISAENEKDNENDNYNYNENDNDNDGITDDIDICPDTPANARVNQKGCMVLGDVSFDSDSWYIKKEMYPYLDEIVDIINNNPNLWFEIQGHTDYTGRAEHNKELSEKRARAVMDYLVDKGVSPERLSAIGLGSEKPVADNKTAEGKKANRRVEFKPIR